MVLNKLMLMNTFFATSVPESSLFITYIFICKLEYECGRSLAYFITLPMQIELKVSVDWRAAPYLFSQKDTRTFLFLCFYFYI